MDRALAALIRDRKQRGLLDQTLVDRTNRHMCWLNTIAEHIVPTYKCLMESYDKAEAVVKDGRETTMDKFQ